MHKQQETYFVEQNFFFLHKGLVLLDLKYNLKQLQKA